MADCQVMVAKGMSGRSWCQKPAAAE